MFLLSVARAGRELAIIPQIATAAKLDLNAFMGYSMPLNKFAAAESLLPHRTPARYIS
jgi:hypothetical protein